MLTDLFITRPSDWRNHAACRPPADADPTIARALADRWYPVGDPRSPAYQRQARDARTICRDCPVREACLRADLADPDRFGIVAGLDPLQRAQLRHTLAVIPAAA